MLTFLAGDANRGRFSVSGFSADTRQDHVRGGSQDETDDSFIPSGMKKEFAGT